MVNVNDNIDTANVINSDLDANFLKCLLWKSAEHPTSIKPANVIYDKIIKKLIGNLHLKKNSLLFLLFQFTSTDCT